MRNSSFFKVFSIALGSLLLTQNNLASARTPQVQYPLAQLAQDGEIVMQLTGDAYRYIDSARVVHGEFSSRLRNDIRTILGPWRNGGRQLTLKADGSARTGFFNRIEGLQAGRPKVLVPLQIEVVSRTQGSSPFLQRAEEDEPEQLAMRDEYSYIADQYDFIKSITEIATEHNEIFDIAAPVDPNLAACSVVHCPESDTISGYVSDYVFSDYDLTPISNFLPRSPAIAGSALFITRRWLTGDAGEPIEVTLENSNSGEVIWLEVVDQKVDATLGIEQFTVLLPTDPVQGQLKVTTADRWTNILDTDYAVVEPDVLPFDAFDPDVVGYSLTNSYLLSVVSQYVYRNLDEPYGTAAYCYNQETVFYNWGLNVRDCLDENGQGWKSDTQALVLENDSAIIIGFAGTQKNVKDIFTTDGDFTQVGWPEPKPKWAYGLHRGFYDAHRTILPDKRHLYQEIVAHAQAAENAGKKIWLTGHSLGGAIAQITAYHLAEDGFDVQGVTTFGAPRVGNY